ncbi:hypothetical protein S245_046450 [Arachis hypogaea]
MSSNQSSSGSASVKENASEVVIVDDDKEEGELEEGEIDDDGADPEASVTERVQSVAECGVVASDTDSTSHKLSVREVLEGVTVANVEDSPHTWYPQARRKHRRIILHVGPTNSGKTHQALKQLESSDSGCFLDISPCDETSQGSQAYILDDIIDHVKYLQLQLKELSGSRLQAESTAIPLVFHECRSDIVRYTSSAQKVGSSE